jgi:hypothetical protein
VGNEPDGALVRVQEVLGRLSNLMVARTAFGEACRQRPRARNLFRQAARVMMDSDRDRPA